MSDKQEELLKREASTVIKREGSTVVKREGSTVVKREESTVVKREGSTLTNKHVEPIDMSVADKLFCHIADKNGDGKINEFEFIQVTKKLHLGSLGEDAARYMFKKVDVNGDGALTIKDIMLAFSKLKAAHDAKNTNPKETEKADHGTEKTKHDSENKTEENQ